MKIRRLRSSLVKSCTSRGSTKCSFHFVRTQKSIPAVALFLSLLVIIPYCVSSGRRMRLGRRIVASAIMWWWRRWWWPLTAVVGDGSSRQGTIDFHPSVLWRRDVMMHVASRGRRVVCQSRFETARHAGEHGLVLRGRGSTNCCSGSHGMHRLGGVETGSSRCGRLVTFSFAQQRSVRRRL